MRQEAEDFCKHCKVDLREDDNNPVCVEPNDVTWAHWLKHKKKWISHSDNWFEFSVGKTYVCPKCGVGIVAGVDFGVEKTDGPDA